jgi:hypothetical protein
MLCNECSGSISYLLHGMYACSWAPPLGAFQQSPYCMYCTCITWAADRLHRQVYASIHCLSVPLCWQMLFSVRGRCTVSMFVLVCQQDARCLLIWSVIPMSFLLAPSGRPSDELFMFLWSTFTLLVNTADDCQLQRHTKASARAKGPC